MARAPNPPHYTAPVKFDTMTEWPAQIKGTLHISSRYVHLTTCMCTFTRDSRSQNLLRAVGLLWGVWLTGIRRVWVPMLECRAFHSVNHCPHSSIHTVSCETQLMRSLKITGNTSATVGLFGIRDTFDVRQQTFTLSTRSGKRDNRWRDVHPLPITSREA